MAENANLDHLNQMKAEVSARDLQIWENVAYTHCIKKETEKLRGEIDKMVKETEKTKKENQMLEEQLVALTNNLDIQRDTLRTSGRSAILQQSLNESLRKEADDLKKKYDETLQEYAKQLEDYRTMYENSCPGYQDLKKQENELKKLEIEKRIIDKKIEDLERSERMYMEIQDMRLRATVVKFAEYYILYHKKENLKKLMDEKKKEEQELLKEHFRLAAEVKEKTKLAQIQSSSTTKEETSEGTKNTKELDEDQVRKFLDEEMLPCSLTPLDSNQKIPEFNSDKSKVKVLDTKILKPPQFKPPMKKSSADVRKKIEKAMERGRQDMMRTGSLQLGVIRRQSQEDSVPPSPRKSGSQDKSDPIANFSQFRAPPPQSTAPVFPNRRDRNAKLSQMRAPSPQSGTHLFSQMRAPSPQGGTPLLLDKSDAKMRAPSPQGGTPVLVNKSDPKMRAPRTPIPLNKSDPKTKCPQMSELPPQSRTPVRPKNDSNAKAPQIMATPLQTEQKEASSYVRDAPGVSNIKNGIVVEEKPEEAASNSILKQSSQEKAENKLLNAQRKTVTFNCLPKNPEIRKFREVKMVKVPKMDLFPKPFSFKSDIMRDHKSKVTSSGALAEIMLESGAAITDSFTMDTGATCHTTYENESADLTLDESFAFGEPVMAFNPIFSQENAQEPANTPFNFSGTQKNNPFNF